MCDEPAVIPDRPGERFDLYADRPAFLLHLLGCLVFVAIGAAGLVWRPSTGRFDVSPGSLGEIVIALCTMLFGSFALLFAWFLLRPGPLVSVGPRGILPASSARDWLPWSAILSVHRADPWIVLLLDETRVPALPLRRRARVFCRMNARLGLPGFYIHGASLRGGLDALEEAVWTASPPHLRGSSA